MIPPHESSVDEALLTRIANELFREPYGQLESESAAA